MSNDERVSSKAVNRAGELLRRGDSAPVAERAAAMEVLGEWRALHSVPLNSMKITLAKYATAADASAIVVQRLKRADSIIKKLRRPKAGVLSQMQDIAGARAVVSDIEAVRRVQAAYDCGRVRNALIKEYDYIGAPQDSGYRGLHRRYRFHGVGPSAPYDGRLVEIQVRTRVQHAWATAVETMGTLLQESLKSSEGPEDWLLLFKEISAAFALLENSPPVPGVEGTRREIFHRVWERSKRLDIHRRFTQFRAALQITNEFKGSPTLFLLSLSSAVGPDTTSLRVAGYREQDQDQAIADYLLAEQTASPSDNVVLVSAASLKALAAAYPNYFLDTQVFLDLLEWVFRSARRDLQIAASLPAQSLQLALPGFGPEASVRAELSRMPGIEVTTTVRGSREFARILWALELARRGSMGALIAAEIANFMAHWCSHPMHSPNVARAFRSARASCQHEDLWEVSVVNGHRAYQIRELGTRELLVALRPDSK